MNSIFKSWQTSLGAVGTLLGVLGAALTGASGAENVGDAIAGTDWNAIFTAISGVSIAFGLFMARDNNKSSEEAN